jgi:phosphate transport system permease protein
MSDNPKETVKSKYLKKFDLNYLVKTIRNFGMKEFFFAFATVSVFSVFFIFVFVFVTGIQVFFDVSPIEFFFGTTWRPTAIEQYRGWGVAPMIIGSVMVSFGALALAVAVGVLAAIFIAEVAPANMRDILKPVIEILAGIPSVVYGFFGLVIVVPWVRDFFNVNVGETAFTGALILSVMILPTIVSVSEDAISAVPRHLKEGSLALGANEFQTIWKVVLPAALSGIVAAIVLAFGRAIGETMAVLMVTGGSPIIPESYLSPVRVMTASIAAEMGEAVQGSTHYHALFALGMILFVITFAVNNLSRRIIRKRVIMLKRL